VCLWMICSILGGVRRPTAVGVGGSGTQMLIRRCVRHRFVGKSKKHICVRGTSGCVMISGRNMLFH